jgi:hypothetical protein
LEIVGPGNARAGAIASPGGAEDAVGVGAGSAVGVEAGIGGFIAEIVALVAAAASRIAEDLILRNAGLFLAADVDAVAE